MATQYAEEFKKDAVRYWKEHPELVQYLFNNSTIYETCAIMSL